MSVTYPERADWIAALLVYTRQQAGILDLMAASRVTGQRSDVPVGSRGIVFEKAGGIGDRFGTDAPSPKATRRVDVNIYGPNEYERLRVWRRLSPILIRISGIRIEAANCLITDIREAAAPAEIPDSDVSDEMRLWWSIWIDVTEKSGVLA